jgi:hypothetical protein
MFILDYQKPEQATDGVADIYAHFLGRSEVPAPLQLLSASPAMLGLQFEQIRYFMGHERLNFPVLAAIRFLAASQVCFDHCQVLNRTWLSKSGLSVHDLDNLTRGVPVEVFSDAENSLLHVVRKVLVKEAVHEKDMETLRGLGWKDSDILDACAQGTAIIGMSYLIKAFEK